MMTLTTTLTHFNHWILDFNKNNPIHYTLHHKLPQRRNQPRLNLTGMQHIRKSRKIKMYLKEGDCFRDAEVD